MNAGSKEAGALAELSAAAGSFDHPVDAYPFRSMITKAWPPRLMMSVVAEPGSDVDSTTAARVAAVVAVGGAVLLVSTCRATRDRSRAALLFLLNHTPPRVRA